MVPSKKKAPTKGVKKPTPEVESESTWYSLANPTGDFLDKFQGLNYYQILDKGVLVESEIGTDKVRNVHFEAKLLEVCDIGGVKNKNSPETPLEGILSVPLSVARKIRAEMEEKELNLESLTRSVVMIQKTGSKMDTRYPTVTIWKNEEYFGSPAEE